MGTLRVDTPMRGVLGVPFALPMMEPKAMNGSLSIVGAQVILAASHIGTRAWNWLKTDPTTRFYVKNWV